MERLAMTTPARGAILAGMAFFLQTPFTQNSSSPARHARRER